MMKTLTAHHIDVYEGDDYFEVCFKKDPKSKEDYFLIQRNFDCDMDEEPDPYMESDDLRFCGHVKIIRAAYSSTRFYIQVTNPDVYELEILFDIQNPRLKPVLNIILSDYMIVF